MKKECITKVTIAALLMGLLLSGCTKKEKEPKKEETPIIQEEVAKEEAEPEKEEVAEEVQVRPYAKGIRTETGFESSWMNMRFTLPEGFTMATDEDLQMMQQGSQEIIAEDDGLEAYAEAVEDVVYEMAILAPDGIGNVNISTEVLPLDTMTAEQYLGIAKAQISQATDITFQIVAENEEVTIGGQTFLALTLHTQMEGISIGQKIYVRKLGERMIIMTSSYQTGNEAQMETVMAAFQPIE